MVRRLREKAGGYILDYGRQVFASNLKPQTY
jgi:hypothetical protein